MRVVHETVAVGFRDLLILHQAAGKVLEGLLHAPEDDRFIEVRFIWSDQRGWSFEIQSHGTDQRYQGLDYPLGSVNLRDWVMMVIQVVGNHIHCGTRFYLADTTGHVEKGKIVLHLDRA